MFVKDGPVVVDHCLWKKHMEEKGRGSFHHPSHQDHPCRMMQFSTVWKFLSYCGSLRSYLQKTARSHKCPANQPSHVHTLDSSHDFAFQFWWALMLTRSWSIEVLSSKLALAKWWGGLWERKPTLGRSQWWHGYRPRRENRSGPLCENRKGNPKSRSVDLRYHTVQWRSHDAKLRDLRLFWLPAEIPDPGKELAKATEAAWRHLELEIFQDAMIWSCFESKIWYWAIVVKVVQVVGVGRVRVRNMYRE